MATEVAGAEAAEASEGRIPAICRNAIAGRRATIRGGAVRRGRTAAGRARWSETCAGAVPAGCCAADAAAGTRAASVPGTGAVPGTEADGVPLARAVLLAGAAPAVDSRVVAPPMRLCRPGVPLPEERVVVAPPDL
ncbi:hypothetical protein OOK13_06625 [Streptomyces sp. NBC_00378]|uniref:hypothetical protein n=1 Tax=unclassified Streptomyces TaxID=2593676 RepID=UPI002252C07F|nr:MULTISPECIES: hypothetical protein [unclassified Streptomyces]MCX5108200.1 hypothetical protein [Streptomyces sp. NBC_00378]